MTTQTRPDPNTRPDPSTLRAAARRTAGLARANAVLMIRNRMTLFYAVIFPLLPMAMLFAGGGSADPGGGTALTTSLTIAFLFPVFYNVLSMMVTRRDELVLKRLRTGEARDGEIALAIALPGVTIAMLVAVLLIPLGMLAGLDAPTNPVLFLLAALVGCATYVGFALWTAAWTRNAEAAQLTSFPVMGLAIVGQLAALMPDAIARVVERTPGAALEQLVRVGWVGEDGETSLTFAQTWGPAVEPLVVLLAWAGIAIWLAMRTMRWEPRS